MSFWFYFIMFGIGILGVIIGVGVHRMVKKKTLSILNEIHRDDAAVETLCMIRNGAIECPGVAQVLGDRMIIVPVVGNRLEIPFSKVRLKKETMWFGRGAFFDKRAFHLDTPYTENLKIGVKDPHPWRRLLKDKFSA